MKAEKIKVLIQVGGEGQVLRVVSRGHGLKRGSYSLPCAVLSASLRTFGRLVSEAQGLVFRGSASGPGDFELNIEILPREKLAWYLGMSDFLVKTLRDLKKDHPEELDLEIIKE